jgi:hypothetical protein
VAIAMVSESIVKPEAAPLEELLEHVAFRLPHILPR